MTPQRLLLLRADYARNLTHVQVNLKTNANPNPNPNPNPDASPNPNANPNPNPNSNPKQREKWYDTEYAELALPKGSLEEWSYPGVPSALSLPEES